MSNLWDVVTGNSNLPVEAGTTFWDHMQNQSSGTGTVLIGGSKSMNISKTLSMNIDKELSMNIKTHKLTFDKSRVLTMEIKKKLEVTICQQ